MKNLLVGAVAVAGLAAAGASHAAIYVTSFQGATFTVNQISSTEFTFDIAGANALTGDWAGATFLGAFAFTDIGSPTTLTATQIVPPGGSTVDTPGGLNASGCDGSGVGFYCFNLTPNVAVAPDLKWDIIATGGTFNFASTGPDLKIDWTTSSTSDTHVGSLFSASIPPGGVIPEPATWAMMILGFGGIGALLRNRRRQALALA